MQSAKGGARFRKPGVDFIINDDISGECAAEVCELVHYIQPLSIDGDVGFLCSLPKAALAFASLALTSSSMTTFLESVLLRYVNLPTTFSRCPLMEMLGSTYGFLGAD